jgi:flagellar hook assembly protein FlgD
MKYISPNHDGVQDSLVIPMSITDSRYISEWMLVVEDAAGKEVRHIGNKDNRPVSITWKTFWQLLFRPKQGVAIPKSVTWDGTDDNGTVVPDGVYSYYLSAADDNANSSTTAKLQVTVDNTPPVVTVQEPSADEKFFGQGSKPQISIQQSGSEEVLWQGSIEDAANSSLKTWTWNKSSPDSITWDGRDNNDDAVPDGVYSYTINATDLAGNKNAPVRISNIIYSGSKPQASIAIKGDSYFSPGTASVKKTVTLVPAISSESTSNNLVSWTLSISDANNAVVRTWAGKNSLLTEVPFDGKDDGGNICPDGLYTASFTARFRNGYQTPPVVTGQMTLDTKAPSATLAIAGKDIFAPGAGSALSSMQINQNFSTENTPWKGEIVNSQGDIVRNIDLGGNPDALFVWRGLDDRGLLSPDGKYRYQVANMDQAGNLGTALSAEFELNVGDTDLLLTFDPEVISPNGDRIQDSLTLSPVSSSSSGIDSYTLNIIDSKGNTVRSFSGKGSIPRSIDWDGKTDSGSAAPDGQYSATLTAVSRNGTSNTVETSQWTIDTVFPSAFIAPQLTLFSPDGDGRKDTTDIDIKTSDEQRWDASINDSTGRVVRQQIWYNAPVASFNWDGRDDSGNVVPDGSYTLSLSSTDAGGNSTTETSVPMKIDTRPASVYMMASEASISPLAGKVKTQNFSINPSLKDGIDTWKVTIVNANDANGTAVKTWSGKGDTLTTSIPWDGKDDSGNYANGSFVAKVELEYLKGNLATSSTPSFICNTLPPELSVQLANVPFSPDNDGENDELLINLTAVSAMPFQSWSFQVNDPQNKKPFWQANGGSAITPTLTWQGKSASGELVQSAMDYPYTFTVTDSQGLSSSSNGLIPVDVLVVKDGNDLRIIVPAIIFRADHADFAGKTEDSVRGLSQEQIDNNNRVLKRIAEVLQKYANYTVTVEGHANPTTAPNTTARQQEETQGYQGSPASQPLSLERAQKVIDELVGYGVQRNRLNAVGMGGSRTVAPYNDRDNNWKNRRVEFLLHKRN